MRAPKSRVITGVVVSAGRMTGACKVRTSKQTYNTFLKKHFQTHLTTLVADPTASLRLGDTISMKLATRGRANLLEILAPWGPGIDERPQWPMPEEREEKRRRDRAAKVERKAERMRLAVNGKTGKEDAEQGLQGGMEGLGGKKQRQVQKQQGLYDRAVKEEGKVKELEGKVGIGVLEAQARVEGAEAGRL